VCVWDCGCRPRKSSSKWLFVYFVSRSCLYVKRLQVFEKEKDQLASIYDPFSDKHTATLERLLDELTLSCAEFDSERAGWIGKE
jgi:hypothetical protein